MIRELFLPVMDNNVRPTKAHALLRMLKDQGWLQRVYTQNVDMLELRAGLAEDDLVECHGSIRHVHCSRCARELTLAEKSAFWAAVAVGQVPRCSDCSGALRPAIVLFGEALPARFQERASVDMPLCDLLLVMGTTLLVYPVASLPSQVSPLCPRALFNNEPSGCFQYVPPCTARGPEASAGPALPRGSSAYRDVFCKGDCDAAAEALAEALGWGSAFAGVVASFA